ncbi:hypothetical protein [Loktanella sp. SALINAS62]|uniref:hypothetical protein n=1 Tax=Loktanella sp. SALINAS62 TaxID=2706124 RepID=UPI001B8C4DFC|nr:hypothetical protein [Loktanella sp. SALINAS62]MBS1301791.1 hypothetical protein [Loktanella sp. SALINAS62]
MTTLILHPGSPKTATSTLQHVLRANRSLLSSAGVGLILPEDLRGKAYLGNYLAAYRGEDVPDMARCTKDFFAPILGRHELVICSEETFCHDFMPSRKLASGGIDRAARSAELMGTTGATRTKVVLSIRPQVNFLTSTYTHFVHRHREARHFSAWLKAEVSLPDLLWQPAVGAFQDRFGAESVQALTLAMTQEVGMNGFLRAALDAFGIGHLGLDMNTDEVHNPSPSQRAVHLCRVMNNEIIHPNRSEKVNTALMSTFPVVDFGKFVPLDWTLPDELASLFEADHSAALTSSKAGASTL